jgi:hypothetical protein
MCFFQERVPCFFAGLPSHDSATNLQPDADLPLCCCPCHFHTLAVRYQLVLQLCPNIKALKFPMSYKRAIALLEPFTAGAFIKDMYTLLTCGVDWPIVSVGASLHAFKLQPMLQPPCSHASTYALMPPANDNCNPQMVPQSFADTDHGGGQGIRNRDLEDQTNSLLP